MRSSILGKILMALIFASVIGGISVGSALGENDHRGQRPEHRGWQDNHARHDNRRWQKNRGWEDSRGWHDNRSREAYRSYEYEPAPVYAPPPVVYAPLPSPGITIFFPPIVIR
jgi:hypothetical protein